MVAVVATVAAVPLSSDGGRAPEGHGTAGVWLDSSFQYALPDGTKAGIGTERTPQRVAHDLNQFAANRTINGAKAPVAHRSHAGLWLLEYGPAPAEVFISGLGAPNGAGRRTFGPTFCCDDVSVSDRDRAT